jgi:hypothetical protein
MEGNALAVSITPSQLRVEPKVHDVMSCCQGFTLHIMTEEGQYSGASCQCGENLGNTISCCVGAFQKMECPPTRRIEVVCSV